MADAWPTAANVLEYQHGHKPMFLETLWVNVKLKLSVPKAGLEMPSIFCSTQGPTGVSVVVPAVTDCHGQASLTCGRRTSSPARCRAADSAASTAHAMTFRNTSPTSTRTAAHVSLRPRPRRRRTRGRRLSRSISAGGSACGGSTHVSS